MSYEVRILTLDGGVSYVLNRAQEIAAEADTEIARLRAAQGWQPIDTAPKDRTWILSFGPVGFEVVAWTKPSGTDKYCDWPDGFYGLGCDFMDQPTHWMPLPPAPGAGKGTSDDVRTQ